MPASGYSNNWPPPPLRTWDPSLGCISGTGVYESVNFMAGGGVIDGQKHPNSQPPHSKELGLWGGVVCAQGLREVTECSLFGRGHGSRSPADVWVRQDSELQTDRKKGRQAMNVLASHGYPDSPSARGWGLGSHGNREGQCAPQLPLCTSLSLLSGSLTHVLGLDVLCREVPSGGGTRVEGQAVSGAYASL